MLEFLTQARPPLAQVIAPGFVSIFADGDREVDRSAPTSYADFIDSPYQIIRDGREIASVLRQVLDARRPVRLTGRRSVRTDDTRLMSLDTARGRILLRELASDPSHSQLLLDGRVNITARHNDIPILFTLELSGSCVFDGIPCYSAPLPAWILFAQMRDSFRIRLPQALDAWLGIHVPGVGRVEARVLDISESGLSALVPAELRRSLSVDDRFHDASLHTRDGTIAPLGLMLRYVGSARGGPQRIGAALDSATESQRQSLRRLIMRHQPLHTASG